MPTTLCPVQSPVLSQQNSPQGVGALRSRDDDDDDDDAKDKERKTDALLCSYETLGKAWPKNQQTQGETYTVMVNCKQNRSKGVVFLFYCIYSIDLLNSRWPSMSNKWCVL